MGFKIPENLLTSYLDGSIRRSRAGGRSEIPGSNYIIVMCCKHLFCFFKKDFHVQSGHWTGNNAVLISFGMKIFKRQKKTILIANCIEP